MKFEVSVVVWLSVMSMAIAGDTTAATAVTPSSEQRLQEMTQMITAQHKEIKQMLTSKQQAAPCLYSMGVSGSSMELLAIKTKLMALETKLEASEAKQEGRQTRLEAKLQAAKAKQKATEAKLEAAKAKQDSTEATLKTLKSNRKGGSTFVQWGRKTCSNTSRLVYSGVAGGSWFDHTGAASNPLCLTMKPQFDGTSLPRDYTFLYGAEYERIPNHHNHDVPCSVCRAPQPTTIMIPATHVCPKGWTTQYTGHLIAGHYTHKAASQYVCLDKDPENANGGNKDDNGYLFYSTITRCGSLPCPPYANNQVVLCVVCSK